MDIGFGGDRLIPELDVYAQRLHKSIDQIVGEREQIKAEIDSILGPEGNEEE
jgi:hypothetical protein